LDSTVDSILESILKKPIKNDEEVAKNYMLMKRMEKMTKAKTAKLIRSEEVNEEVSEKNESFIEEIYQENDKAKDNMIVEDTYTIENQEEELTIGNVKINKAGRNMSRWKN
jgi:predicted choloylglycine hydrolase